MAMITNFGFLARLRSDAASHVISYANGQTRRSGRGLSFWFLPYKASIAELPMDDRELTLFVKGRSRDFQALSLQGALTWRIVDPDRLAERIDFTIALDGGGHRGEPLRGSALELRGRAGRGMIGAAEADAEVATRVDVRFVGATRRRHVTPLRGAAFITSGPSDVADGSPERFNELDHRGVSLFR